MGEAPDVAGLDLSLTATGIATWSVAYTFRPSTSGDKRLVEIRDEVLEACWGRDLVVIEDLPKHASGAGITAMLQGVVRAELVSVDVPYALVAPATLKKYATGKGNSAKPAVAVAAYRRAGVEFVDDNACDAWWCWAMATDLTGTPAVTLPADNRSTLKTVKGGAQWTS